MGRMKPAWYYTRQAQEATARANYFANRVPSADTTVNSRGASTTLYYRSMLLTDGTDPLIFSVNVLNSTLAAVPAAQAGLLTVLGAGDFALPMRGSGVKPTMARWYKGAATPTAKNTAWGTRRIQYYDASDGSHKSIPISRATGTITPAEIQTAFNTIFNGGNKTALLGTQNGRAFLEFERTPFSTQT